VTSAADLRETRARLAGDERLRGTDFGKALSEGLDAFLSELLGDVEVTGRWSLLALGSYARRELCPGSDVDLMLLHDGTGSVDAAAAALWYPLWDAGFVLGHSVRTAKEALRLADGDVDALTSLLELRVVGGDRGLGEDLSVRAANLAQRRRRRLVTALADGAEARAARPGPIAEMLDPNLKDGAGGLRDVQALEWAGRALGDERDGTALLVERGYLQPGDPSTLATAKATLLDVRVALHRVTDGRSDLLALQEQDAVADRLGAADADALVRQVADAGRRVAWIAADAWERLRSAERGPLGRVARRDRAVADGVVLRDGRIALTADAAADAGHALQAAAAAASHAVTIDRQSLDRLGDLAPPTWDATERAAFIDLLAAGRAAVPVLEALDQVGALTRLIPEWEGVRALPQRNAYHRHTVDRHLLECAAECAVLLDDPGRDGDVARRAPRVLLLLGALLHDIGKGSPGDHSVAGAEVATTIGRRFGLDERELATLDWLVRNHLLLAETATRRDLSEEATITRFGRAVGDDERLDLLYALTVADSRATGPAAWNPAKAALARELFLRTDALLDRGVVSSPAADARRRELAELVGTAEADAFLDAMPAAYASAFDAAALAHHRDLLDGADVAVEWVERSDGRLECTVAAADSTGLLATVSGVLSLVGFDIRDAAGYSHSRGRALEVFTGVDRFGRLTGADDRTAAEQMLREALDGSLPLAERLRERARRYHPGATPTPGDVTVTVDLHASDFASVVEIHAPDHVGLLAQMAAVFAERDLDVSQALVATLADRVVDVFYVRGPDGGKVTDPGELAALEQALLDRLGTETATT